MPAADYQSHPLFRRGASPKVRLVVYVAVCVAMLALDLKFKYFEGPRKFLSAITYPISTIAGKSTRLLGQATQQLTDIGNLQAENAALRQRQFEDANRLLRFDELERENLQLRALLRLSKKTPVISVASEVLYNVPDAFSRKVIIDQGEHVVQHGLAVADADGLIGQITRVYPFQSEVTLITDSSQPVSVRVQRNGLRGITFGSNPETQEEGSLELRYVLINADIKPDDILETSGLDGIFLPGLPVAKVVSVNRESGSFARILCQPLGGVETSTRVLVLGRA
ncbi:MAG: rod shape-determining protein MreC, partial [Azoarcus sp.]|nr:rod shape-determining protein MreC [Azoarcus sp.]